MYLKNSLNDLVHAPTISTFCISAYNDTIKPTPRVQWKLML